MSAPAPGLENTVQFRPKATEPDRYRVTVNGQSRMMTESQITNEIAKNLERSVEDIKIDIRGLEMSNNNGAPTVLDKLFTLFGLRTEFNQPQKLTQIKQLLAGKDITQPSLAAALEGQADTAPPAASRHSGGSSGAAPPPVSPEPPGPSAAANPSRSAADPALTRAERRGVGDVIHVPVDSDLTPGAEASAVSPANGISTNPDDFIRPKAILAEIYKDWAAVYAKHSATGRIAEDWAMLSHLINPDELARLEPKHVFEKMSQIHDLLDGWTTNQEKTKVQKLLQEISPSIKPISQILTRDIVSEEDEDTVISTVFLETFRKHIRQLLSSVNAGQQEEAIGIVEYTLNMVALNGDMAVRAEYGKSDNAAGFFDHGKAGIRPSELAQMRMNFLRDVVSYDFKYKIADSVDGVDLDEADYQQIYDNLSKTTQEWIAEAYGLNVLDQQAIAQQLLHLMSRAGVIDTELNDGWFLSKFFKDIANPEGADARNKLKALANAADELIAGQDLLVQNETMEGAVNRYDPATMMSMIQEDLAEAWTNIKDHKQLEPPKPDPYAEEGIQLVGANEQISVGDHIEKEKSNINDSLNAIYELVKDVSPTTVEETENAVREVVRTEVDVKGSAAFLRRRLEAAFQFQDGRIDPQSVTQSAVTSFLLSLTKATINDQRDMSVRPRYQQKTFSMESDLLHLTAGLNGLQKISKAIKDNHGLNMTVNQVLRALIPSQRITPPEENGDASSPMTGGTPLDMEHMLQGLNPAGAPAS